ncbi:MAG: c-type cytochrome [Planctomycetales bacterium]|nr:c-type cytochrome [Planctomycetales bacterium]
MRCIAICTLVLVASEMVGLGIGRAATHDEPRHRRPAALALSPDEDYLYVANERAGSISVLDTNSGSVLREVQLGGKLVALTHVSRDRFLAADEAGHRVLDLRMDGTTVEVRRELKVSPYPVRIVVAPGGGAAFVTSLWSRRVSRVDLEGENCAVTGTVDLAFAPREQLLVPGAERLVVADSHGGNLAVIDLVSLEVLGYTSFPAHNIRGLGVSPDGKMMLIAHQMLNELAHTVRNDVHWGLLMTNDLRWLPVDAVLSRQQNLYKGAHMHPLGEAGSATGDPAGLAIHPDGRVIVTLGGVGEIAIGNEEDFSLRRYKVGRRPTAVVIARTANKAFVANTFDDSISLVTLDAEVEVQTKPLGPKAELSEVDYGEMFFYDARLSHDRWMSCHSCHTDGHTNGLLNDNFSDRSFGAPKRVLSLLGKNGTEPLAWNASAASFEEQVHKSLKMTMQSDDEPRERLVARLAAYVRTLESPPSLDQLRGVQDPEAIGRGQEVFGQRKCTNCHQAPHYTSPKTYNVGLQDEQGNNRFNPPALRGLSQRGPYFHDNRAKSLEEVFVKYQHRLREPLTDQELQDLLAFLRSL